MTTRRTYNFLPTTFQTDTNRKFLSATLDQLVTDPALIRLNGYIGRKFAPTYRTDDSYITEPSTDRQNYQLEPSVVIKNNNQVDFYSGYTDLLNKIDYYGGLTTNHDRLFNSEYYTYNGLFDFDKFVNYNQYYWLPNGPDPVLITSVPVATQQSFTVARDENQLSYIVDNNSDTNPEIVLVRGGNYKFTVNQPGHKFWIQTEPGVSGKKISLPTVSSRNVLGVTNNGAESGTVEFLVPLIDAQDEFLKMPMLASVDYAVIDSFTSFDGKLLDTLLQNDAFDGVKLNPNSKTIVFLNPSSNSSDWTKSDSTVVDPQYRHDIYRIRLSKDGMNRDVVNLDYFRAIPKNFRIYSRLGLVNANTEYYKNSIDQLAEIPVLTAQLNTLYYQDSSSSNMYGKISIVNDAIDRINVEDDILGQINYTAPSGVVFSNGLVVKFDNTVTPSKFQNKTYVVEGVGKSIRLINFDYLISAEANEDIGSIPFDINSFEFVRYDASFTGPAKPNYVTINKSSLDLNPWSRQNRWFHIDVLRKTAEYNNSILVLDQAIRAQRPIIEFEPDIQLYNFGKIGKKPVDIIDTVNTDAFNQVQHSRSLTVNGVTFAEGQRVLFANDSDPLVKEQIYVIQYLLHDEPSFRTKYDGTNVGTVTIKPKVIDFVPVNTPQYQSDDGITWTYEWLVAGLPEILTASKIDNLYSSSGAMTGTVVDVINTVSNQYVIRFTTSAAISQFFNQFVDIVSSRGTVTVIGNQTSFSTELSVGAQLYVNNQLIGTVGKVLSDTKLQLNKPSTVFIDSGTITYINPKIRLMISPDPEDSIEQYDCVSALYGENSGKSYWYNGTSWTLGQTKTKVFQPPLFDVFDNSDSSFHNYLGGKFVGTKIFSYKVGSGTNDTILGFPLSYNTGSDYYNVNLADIAFDNNFGIDTFDYLVGSNLITKKIDTGYIKQNITRQTFQKRNIWSKVNELSKQYQIISHTFTGKTAYFEIDIQPDTVVNTPNIKVFVNNILLDNSKYDAEISVGSRKAVRIQSGLLNVGDKIDILIYSNNTSQLGYYQIPNNLDYNSKNLSFNSLSLGQLRNNLIAISQNLNNVQGAVPGDSNLRDFNIKSYGGNILQHSAPIIYGSLFLIHEQANFVNALDYARREYTKFKNKFVELAGTLDLNQIDIGGSVDKILTTINAVKNKSFSWYYSDMVPYGDCTVLNYTVLNPSQRQYKINTIYNDTVLNNRAVLVYFNGRQLVKDIDYSFDSTRPAVILADSLAVHLDDKIQIRDYTNTDGNYIPETPTKLGLYPKFKPEIYFDDTYRDPVEVIQGHDGSLTPVFNDYRDQLILELELRIYNNLKTASDSFDNKQFIPGRFRSGEYTLREFTSIVNNNFLKWLGSNRVDYLSNPWFDAEDQFTFNYSSSRDKLFSEKLPGYWRGIYQYFYDTDRPHTHPWEMLGFSQKPTWWDNYYGAAPYTSENLPLWTDLEDGLIREGSRKGIDPLYARPNLKKIIPVDASGNLLPPRITVAQYFNTTDASDSFAIGDVGPVEAAWRRTSEYPYAVQYALAITKPAWYFGTKFDVSSYTKNSNFDQYLNSPDNQRVSPLNIKLNGETVGNEITRTSGYLNWIVDYITNLGISGISRLRFLLDNLEVQLSYKLAGYADKKYLTVLAEQYSPTSTNESIIVPDDSYSIVLNKSVPIEKINYSAVIIQKSDNGYVISGYSVSNPYFTIVPSDSAGGNYTINIDDQVATIYQTYRPEKVVIPYGYEFSSKQQVVDFLVSYQRYLFAQGFTFEEYDEDLAQVKDWILSVREFLSWTRQGWKPGSIIVLSPVGSSLNILTTESVVDQITNSPNGSKIVDPNFNVIKLADLSVMRDSGEFKVQAIKGQTIAYAELSLTQFEHVLIFDNLTVFGDVIYKPELGSRQFRLKLVGSKTANWDGSLSPEGFVFNNSSVPDWQPGKDYRKGDLVNYKNQYYVAIDSVAGVSTFNLNSWRLIDKNEIKTGLLPNWANLAGRFIDIYDSDNSTADPLIAKMGSSLIGFRTRNYLTDLNVDKTSQLKFYQGMIRQKGTGNSITDLISAQFNKLENRVNFYEEWGFRVGEYGALKTNQVVEVAIDENRDQTNPIGLVFADENETVEPQMIPVKQSSIYNKSSNTPVRFLNRNSLTKTQNDIESAGYVYIDDVDSTIFDFNEYTSLNSKINEIYAGYTIWVAKDLNKDWNVYRVTESECYVNRLNCDLGNSARVTTNQEHGLVVNQTVVIKNFRNDFDGFYIVTSVISPTEFLIDITEAQTQALQNQAIEGIGILFRLISVRVNSPDQVNTIAPIHGWQDGDKFWSDSDENGLWSVYEKSSPWTYYDSLGAQIGTFNSDGNYGTSIKISTDGSLAVIGAPGDVNGAGRLYVFTLDGITKEKGVLHSGLISVGKLGYSVDFANNYLVAGAPGTDLNSGVVIVYTNTGGIYFEPMQVILNPTTYLGSEFGTSVSQSEDAHWLYIGSPASNEVHLYRLKEYQRRVNTYRLDQAIVGCELPYTVDDPESLAVYVQGDLKVLDRDYFVTGNVVNILALIVNESSQAFVLEDGRTSFSAEEQILDEDFVVIIRRTFYKYKHTLQNGSGTDRFGQVVHSSRDGSVVIVGSPVATSDSLIEAGKTYVYYNTKATSPTLELLQELTLPDTVYSAKLGTSIQMCNNNCSVYVGAPGYSNFNFSGGQVARYINIGRVKGQLTSTIQNPTVVPGDSILINDVEVVFTGTDLASVVNDINAIEIVGVRAKEVDGYLVITSRLEVAYEKLIVYPGAGSAFYDLGFTTYELVQLIQQPTDREGELFGNQIRLNKDSNFLLIASTTGTVKSIATYDNKTTKFDGYATRFLDITLGSGTVYGYDYLPTADSESGFGEFVYAQEFNAPGLKFGDKFGSGIDVKDTQLLIGAAFNDTKNNNAGAVYRYTNLTQQRSWNKIRQQTPIVDINAINFIGLFDKKTKLKITNLDYIDPIKGKNLGEAEQNINYKTSVDPAVYNAGSLAADEDYHWGPAQVGQTWWDLDSVRYIEYEQDLLIYRMNNWGKLFPGSQVRVFEWVESPVLPSDWSNAGYLGTPLHSDNSGYVIYSSVDADTGLVTSRYYFWVQDVIDVAPGIKRTMSTKAIELSLLNPMAQSLPYAAVLSDRSVALFNCEQYLRNTNVILKIDYDNKLNDSLIHSEYQLVQEGNPDSEIPRKIITKLVDSLSGIDERSQRVPDLRLSESQKYGLSVRPRQTIIGDKSKSLKNLAQYANSVFETVAAAYKLQNSRKFDNAALFSKTNEPDSSLYTNRVENLTELEYLNKSIGDKILVAKDSYYYDLWTIYEVLDSQGSVKLIANQTKDTTKLWNYKNWYVDGFDPATKPNYIVEYYKDISKLSLVNGDIVQVEKTTTGGYEIYQFDADLTPSLLAVENGTIILDDTLWDTSISGVGYDNKGYEGSLYDLDYGSEIRDLLHGLETEIFVDDIKYGIHGVWFTVLKTILSEQKNIDWIFKTSFITVLHKIKQLAEFPNYVRDNHTYYQEYINEVKPYRTKIREYRLGYEKTDVAGAQVLDFDVPAYYDRSEQRFRSPSGELASDREKLQESDYYPFMNNRTCYIGSIIIADAGENYTQPPQVEIIANNDGGSGATAEAFINESTGQVIQITVTNPGSGYINTPYVLLNGTGSGARAYPILQNDTIRSIKTLIKFDRLTHVSNVREWQSGVTYNVGDMVSYQYLGYRALVTHSSTAFDSSKFELISINEYISAADRIAAQYNPGKFQIPREIDSQGRIDLRRIIQNAGYEYNLIDNDPVVFNESIVQSWPAYNRTGGTNSPDINITGGTFYDKTKSYAPEELIPGTTVDNLSIRVETQLKNEGNSYIFRINKNAINSVYYNAIDRTKLSTLAAPLYYNDTVIQVTDLTGFAVPDRTNRIPGVVYINGEKIHYYTIDTSTNTLGQLLRGVDNTGVPDAHGIGTVVEDMTRAIPGHTVVNQDNYIFNKDNPTFIPAFSVRGTLEDVVESLRVFNNNRNLLTYAKDYTLELVTVGTEQRVRISFVRASTMANGIRINVKYAVEYSWLIVGGPGTISGSALQAAMNAGTTSDPAGYLKQFPHPL